MKIYKSSWFSVDYKWGFSFTYYVNQAIFINLLCFDVYFNLNVMLKRPYESRIKKYGFTYNEDSLFFYFKDKMSWLNMPWQYNTRHVWWLCKDMTYVNDKDYDVDVDEKKIIWLRNYVYNYKDQETIATVRVVKYEKRMNILRFCELFKKDFKKIEVQFANKIGDNVHTWRGGVGSISYKMNDNESPYHCLRRLEREKEL